MNIKAIGEPPALPLTATMAFVGLRKRTSSAALGCAVSGVCLILTLLGSNAHADTWGTPTEFDTLSENGRFIAHVIPAPSTNSKPIVFVSSIQDHRTNELWRTTLSNDTCPNQVCVWDKGTCVVTLDSWGGIGYGQNVVAVYGPEGQRARYSLEEFAPLPKPKSSSALKFSLLGGYREKFSHSTSSRYWRSYSIYFFSREADQVLFCLWLDWDNRWVAWRMSDGKLMEVSPDQAKQFNSEGRRRALQFVGNDDAPAAALNYLGRLRHQEDRPLIEAWLRDMEFCTGSITSYSSDGSEPSFSFTAYSSKRREAENILSCWDGLTTNISKMGHMENYHYLGTLEGCISVISAPKKGDGTLRLYLIPAAVSLAKWSQSRPEHYLIVDLNDDFSEEFDDQKFKDLRLTRTVIFSFYGVTPGNYRLKAVWNKVAPLTEPDTIVCVPHSGDYQSVSSPVISIKPGKVTEGVQIKCTTPAGKQRGRK